MLPMLLLHIPESLQSVSLYLLCQCLHLIQIQSDVLILLPLSSTYSASFLNHPISALSILCSSFFWGSNILLHTEILIERKLPINRFLFGLLRICFFCILFVLRTLKMPLQFYVGYLFHVEVNVKVWDSPVSKYKYV